MFKAGEIVEQLYYTGFTSPKGRIWAASTDVGLFRVTFAQPFDEFLGSIKRVVDAEVIEDSDRFDLLGGLLKAYFDGEPVVFDVPFDLRGTEFQKTVWRAVHEIPYGRLSSYGRVAAAVGRPRAARAVGNALGANPLSIVIPCHRVIRSDGSIGGFGGRPDLKRYLLGLEGILPRTEKKELKSLGEEYPKSRRDLLRYFFE